jgi:GT2 family glycosyltransferase
MRLAIVIVNYRTADLVYNCLLSLFGQIQTNIDNVIVVDNNSGDDSVDKLSKRINTHGWKNWVSVLPLEYNLGFSAGNNGAIRALFLSKETIPDYIMLLNPDTIVHPGSIQYLVKFLNENPEVGIVGSQLENENHQLESAGRRYPSPLSELDTGAGTGFLSKLLKQWRVVMPIVEYAHQCDWVSGAAMMARRVVFEQIGLMDEGYFLYYEELDFCRRADRVGWQIWLEPRSLVTHIEGQATGKQNNCKRRGKYWYNSRRRYFIKHQGFVGWFLADIFWYIGRLFLLIRKKAKLRGDMSQDPLYFTRDLIVGDLKALFSGEALRIKRERK